MYAMQHRDCTAWRRTNRPVVGREVSAQTCHSPAHAFGVANQLEHRTAMNVEWWWVVSEKRDEEHQALAVMTQSGDEFPKRCEPCIHSAPDVVQRKI